MDAHGLVYGSRPQSPDMMAGQMMAPQYMVTHPYSSAQMQSMTTPSYQNAAVYQPYHNPTQLVPAPVAFKNEFQQQPDGRLMFQDGSNNGSAFARDDVKPFVHNEQSPSPSLSRRGSQISMAELEENPTKNSKTITANETLDPKDRIDFDTDVDQLMKALQHDGPPKSDAGSQALTPAASPKAEEASARSSPVSPETSPAPQGTAKPKKYICDGPSCNKSFSQKTHLDIHRRTHTGLRPYICKFEGCNLTFSQLGNLKTHQRRHTGDRPYQCSKCDKTFAQKGNVKSHEETHEGKKPFVCRLEGCYKTFSQLGNMKTHQNNFHKDALNDLTSKFVQFTNEGYVPEEYRSLFEYFKLHYKNSNKGIKGRGKARKIAGKDTHTTPRKTTIAATKPATSSPKPQMPAQEPMYTMANGPTQMVDCVPRSAPAGTFAPLYAIEAHSPNAGQVLYEDEQARQMAFTDRLY